MSPRHDLLLAAVAAGLLIVVAFATGRGARATDDPDARASSFLTGREGARALADAAERLGAEVIRWRRRPQALDSAWGGRNATLAILEPSVAPGEADRDAIVRWPLVARGGALVVAGESSREILRCFGVSLATSIFDSTRVARVAGDGVGGERPSAGELWVHARFAVDTAARRGEVAGDAGLSPAGGNDGRVRRGRGVTRTGAAPCPDVRSSSADTLLRDEGGAPVLLQLTVAPLGRRVVLASDAALVRNRSLRAGRAGAVVAAAIVPRAGTLIFDEYHQGFAPGGSMAGAVVAWSARHPLGWMAWQVVVVGLLALAAGAVRAGPVRAAIPRRRREGREHVEALATALAAAGGRREAIAALVHGLRRRLTPGGPAGRGPHAPLASRHTGATPRDDWRAWLASLERRAPSAEGQHAARRLLQLADDPRDDAAVVEGARAVDALWDALRPAPPPA